MDGTIFMLRQQMTANFYRLISALGPRTVNAQVALPSPSLLTLNKHVHLSTNTREERVSLWRIYTVHSTPNFPRTLAPEISRATMSCFRLGRIRADNMRPNQAIQNTPQRRIRAKRSTFPAPAHPPTRWGPQELRNQTRRNQGRSNSKARTWGLPNRCSHPAAPPVHVTK